MANTRSAKKRIRQGQTRRLRNRIVRTRVRTAVKLAKEPASAAEKNKGGAAVLEAIQQLDKAASKGVIHRKNAARRKRRLLRHVKASPKS